MRVFINYLREDILKKRNLAVVLLGLASLYIIIFEIKTVSLNIRGSLLIVLSFCLSYLLTPVFSSIAWQLGIVDHPSNRKMHQQDTSLLGGVAVYLAFSISAVSIMWFSYELKGVVYAATIVFLLGLADDIFKLSSVFRLGVQLIAVFVLFFHGLEVHFAPNFFNIHVLDKLITILWIIGITNAVNFLDGIDGLCGGFGAIAAFFFGVLAFLTKQYFLMFLAFSLAGSCIGFLPWNFRPHRQASVFLGDAGSIFIGFTLASFAIMGDWAENKLVGLSIPILILCLPIYDISMTTFFRFKEGKVKTIRQWLDYVGKDHFHHRVYELGMGRGKSVLFMYVMNIMLGFSAVIVRTGGTLEAYLTIIQAFIVLSIFTVVMVNAKNKYDQTFQALVQNKAGDELGIPKPMTQ